MLMRIIAKRNAPAGGLQKLLSTKLFLQIHMKTMPTSMYRLLTGQETPVYI